jgi:hypothetical protein
MVFNKLRKSFLDKLQSVIVFIPQQKGIADKMAAELCERVSDEFTVNFIQWMNEPIHGVTGALSHQSRCLAQAPEYKEYIITDNNGLAIEFDGKRFFTLAELLKIYKEQYHGTRKSDLG